MNNGGSEMDRNEWLRGVIEAAQAELRGEVVEVSDCNGGHWSHRGCPEFFSGLIYRAAPATVTIPERVVPAPMTEAPELRATYFVSLPHASNLRQVFQWIDSDFDRRMLDRGLAYATREDAIARARAMLTDEALARMEGGGDE